MRALLLTALTVMSLGLGAHQARALSVTLGEVRSTDLAADPGITAWILASPISIASLEVLTIDSDRGAGGPIFYDRASGVFISFQDRIGGSLGTRAAGAHPPIPVERDALVAANFDGIDRVGVVFRGPGALGRLK